MHIRISLTQKNDKDMTRLVQKKTVLSHNSEEMELELKILNISSSRIFSRHSLEACPWDIIIADVTSSERIYPFTKLLTKLQSAGRSTSRRLQLLLRLRSLLPHLHNLTFVPKLTQLFYNSFIPVQN
jgi:hypothetical protein